MSGADAFDERPSERGPEPTVEPSSSESLAGLTPIQSEIESRLRQRSRHNPPPKAAFDLAASISLEGVHQRHLKVEPVWVEPDSARGRVIAPTLWRQDRIELDAWCVVDERANDFGLARVGNVSRTRCSRSGEFATERILRSLPVVLGRATVRWKCGADRAGRFAWVLNKEGTHYLLQVVVEGAAVQVLKAFGAWYLDKEEREVGRIVGLGGFEEFAWDLPPVPMAEADGAFIAAARATDGVISPPSNQAIEVMDSIEPSVHLRFFKVRQSKTAAKQGLADVPCMEMSLRYAQWDVAAGGGDLCLQSADGNAVRVIRHRDVEERVQAVARSQGLVPFKNSGQSIPRSATNVDRIWVFDPEPDERDEGRRWAIVLQQMSSERHTLVVDEDFPAQAVHARGQWNARSSFDGRKWLEVEFEVSAAGRTMPGSVALRALAEERSWLTVGDDKETILLDLGGGQFIEQRLGDLREIVGPLFEGMGGVDDDGTMRVHRSQVLNADRSRVNWIGKQKDLDRLLTKAREIPMVLFERNPSSPLRDYQYDGMAWMVRAQARGLGALLADDCGLGKTAQVVLLNLYLKVNRLTRGPILHVVLSSNVGGTEHEYAQWAPSLRVRTIVGGDRQALYEDLGEVDVILTTYDVAYIDCAQYLSRIHFDVGIFDEISILKSTKGNKRAVLATLDIDFRLGMSATPIENNLGDLYSIFDFVEPGCLGSQRQFMGLHRNAQDDPAAMDVLLNMVRPMVLRRTRDEVAWQIPPHTSTVIRVDLNPDQRLQYDMLKTMARLELERLREDGGLAAHKGEVLRWIGKLRGEATEPRLVCGDLRKLDPIFHRAASSAKLEILLGKLNDLIATQHRVVVVSQWTRMIDIVAGELKRSRVTFNRLDGGMSPMERDKQLRDFQDHPETAVFLLSLKAGGYGLNALVDADIMIIMDPWWNPQVEHQVICRVDRPGKKRESESMRLVAANTIEEWIEEIKERKGKLAADFLSGLVGGDFDGFTEIGRAHV